MRIWKNFEVWVFLFPFFLFLISGIYVLQILAGEELCSKENASKKLEQFVVSALPVDVKPACKIHSVSKISLGDFSLCEVIYSFEAQPNKTQEDDVPVFKSIFYYGKDFAIIGEIKKLEPNGQVLSLTRERITAANKEYIDYVQRKALEAKAKSEDVKALKEEISKNFEKIKSQADIKIGKGKVEVIVFVDPFCPHCGRMKFLLLEKAKENKLSAYFLFMPLGQASEKVTASIVCDKKTDSERLQAFIDKYSGDVCEKGLKKVKENVDLFVKLKGQGVPYMILKKGSEIEIIEGAISKERLESYLE